MSAPDYFAAHTVSADEQLRLQGLELTWDPFTHRRLLAAGVGEGQRALALNADQHISVVSPTLFAAVAHLP
jgi:hypothetical protein